MIEYVRKKNVTVPVSQFSGSHKIHSLASSRCPAFFPADVILTQNNVHLRYSTAGYHPLSKQQEMRTDSVLEVVKKVIQCVQDARDWMWFPQDYLLLADTVWINSEGLIKILCIPDRSAKSGTGRFCTFLHDLKRTAQPSAASYLQFLQDMCADGNMRTELLLSEIDQMIAEVRSYL